MGIVIREPEDEPSTRRGQEYTNRPRNSSRVNIDNVSSKPAFRAISRDDHRLRRDRDRSRLWPHHAIVRAQGFNFQVRSYQSRSGHHTRPRPRNFSDERKCYGDTLFRSRLRAALDIRVKTINSSRTGHRKPHKLWSKYFIPHVKVSAEVRQGRPLADMNLERNQDR